MVLKLQGRAISGALKYAVDQINNCSSLLPDVELDFIYNDTQVRASSISGIRSDIRLLMTFRYVEVPPTRCRVGLHLQ